jgi:TIR domain-containing protein
MTAIFISHSSADNASAAEMKAWLEAQGHTSLFLDFDPEAGIKGGSGWEQTLYRQLRRCQAVIALLTPSCLASKWCFAELVQAWERGKAIFPVKVQLCAVGGVFRLRPPQSAFHSAPAPARARCGSGWSRFRSRCAFCSLYIPRCSRRFCKSFIGSF